MTLANSTLSYDYSHFQFLTLNKFFKKYLPIINPLAIFRSIAKQLKNPLKNTSMDTLQETSSKEKISVKIELSKASLQNLYETSQWTKFLSIVAFIFIGLMIILGFSLGFIMSAFSNETITEDFPGYIFGIIYLAGGLIYFFPILFLFKFSSYLKKALVSKDAAQIDMAFKNLKSHFRYVGILTIIMLGIYAVGIMFALIGGLAMGFAS